MEIRSAVPELFRVGWTYLNRRPTRVPNVPEEKAKLLNKFSELAITNVSIEREYIKLNGI
jgi:hypothetical protein